MSLVARVDAKGEKYMVQSEEEEVRRSKAYPRVYALLIEAAEQKQLATYGQIAAIMGLPTTGHYMGKMVGIMLDLITSSERECDRPMLSSMAVSSTNQKPGDGFYALAEQYSLIAPDASKDEKLSFWRAQRDLVYEEWSS
jgi:alkylated DNA nucleotide flippase Atl1